jgi:2-dehydropantoate 2-reductase
MDGGARGGGGGGVGDDGDSSGPMRAAVLGPGGVGGLVAGVLFGAGAEVVVVAREETAEAIADQGLSVHSVMFGDLNARVRARARLASDENIDVLIVATKAAGLRAALERVECEPRLVLPLLNGLDHLAVLRERFDPGTVLASTIRVESDRPEPGVVVHTSRFLLIDMATHNPAALPPMRALAATLEQAGIPVRVTLPVSERSEAQVMWSKLVRLNALACTTSAYDTLLGEIRSTPRLRADLVATIEEASAVGRAEGAADVDPQRALGELELAHDTLGSSMRRDIAAGRPPELDAIPGAILRAAARHGLPCPTIERLVATIAARAGVPAPVVQDQLAG